MGLNVKVRNCTNRSAAKHSADPDLPAYTCSPCLLGYVENGTKCEGQKLALRLYNFLHAQTQQSIKLIILKNIKIVGVLPFINMINTSEYLNQEQSFSAL